MGPGGEETFPLALLSFITCQREFILRILQQKEFRMQSAQSMRSGARSIFNDVSRKAARAAAFSTEIEDAHTTACSNKQNTYKDPATGYTVFTEYAHIKRGTCCGNICRHCPYAHHAVENPEWRNKNQFKNITKPTLLRSKRPDIDSSGGSSKRKYTTDLSRPVDVLFYSGGKNSFLSLMQLQEEERAARPTDTFLSEVILATTYNHWDGTLPHQVRAWSLSFDFRELYLCSIAISVHIEWCIRQL